MDTSEMLRILCRRNRISMAEIARRIGQSSQNLSQKIKRGTINMDEMALIADSVGAEYLQSFALSPDDVISMRVKNGNDVKVSESMKNDNLPDLTIAKKFCVSLFYIHLAEDRIDVLFAPEGIKKKYGFGTTYTEVANDWLDMGLVDQDRDEFAKRISRKNFINELKKKDVYSIVFCTKSLSEKKYMEALLVRDGDSSNAYLAIVDKNDEIRDMFELEKKSKKISFMDSMLFSAMSEMYERMFICNLTKNTFHEINADDDNVEAYEIVDGSYEDFLRITSATILENDEKKRFLSFFDKKNLLDSYERNERRLTYFCEAVSKDFSKRDIDIICILKENPEGDIVLVTMAHNITDENDRVRRIDILRDQERQKNELIMTLTKRFASVYKVNLDDATYEVIKLNGRSEKVRDMFEIKGNSYEENCKRWIEQFVHEDDRDALLEAIKLKNLRAELDKNGSLECVFRDMALSKPQYFRMYAESHQTTEGGKWAIVVFIDVDDMIREETESQAVLKKALKQANVAVEAKRKFLFNMSHDIRTPLNAIIGFSQVAMLSNNLSPKMVKCLEKIKESGDSLLHMLNDVLEMSNLESGDVGVEESKVEKAEIGRNVISMIQQAAFMKNIRFSYSVSNLTEGMVWCDLNKVNQILINLLTNAVNFTPEGGNIVYTVEQIPIYDPDYENFRFCVKDSGIGISEEFIEGIFDPFTKENTSTDSGVDGSGLGLTIASRLAEMMNGKITVESEKGVGSTFCLNISFRKARDSEDNEVIKVRSYKLKGHNVLIADNDRLNTSVLKKMFLNMGMIADVSETKDETLQKLEKAEKEFYTVIFVSEDMNGKNGDVFIRDVKQCQKKRNMQIPIIVMAHNNISMDVMRYFDAGADEYVSKPLNIGNIKSILAKILR